jgi:starch phosphorylase
MHLADFQSYIQAQQQVDETYQDEDKWTRMVLMNIANMGKFSSDRTILEYSRDVWNIKPCPIELPK